MKAYRKTLQLDKGLQPIENMVMNSAWLRQAKGVYRGQGGIEKEPEITTPWSAETSWPFPQILNLRQELLLGRSTSLVLVNADWSLTTLLSGESSAVFWQVADFGSVYYLTNGLQVFVRDVDDDSISELAYSSIPKMGTLCNFKGQLVGGRVLGTWQDCDEGYAAWSSIGSHSFDPDWKNEAGWRDMEIGDIYICDNLQDKMVVFYGAEGIAVLVPADNTFGYQKLISQGLYGRCSVGFGSFHLAILQDGNLWKISNEGIEKLGYRAQMLELEEDDIRISWDDKHELFYITDGDTSYIYANSHLTEAHYKPTSLGLLSGELVGQLIWGTGHWVEVELTWQDLNLATMKTVEFIELGIVTDGSVWGNARVMYSLGSRAIMGMWKPVNESGYCYISMTGNKFTILVKVQNATEFRLDYITYGVKVTDNRIQNQLQTMQDGSWNVN